MKVSTIGGQGVLEGVMMRAPETSALAVRKESGEIATKVWSNKKIKYKFLTWPVIRGVVNFVSMMVQGVSTITDAAKLYDESNEEDFEPSKFEKYVAEKTGKSAMDVMMVFAVIIALAFSVGLFFILPTLITGWLKGSIQSSLLINLIDGLVRMVLFLGYMSLVSLMKDIKRVFMYHGAEHKTIFCYENELEMTVENVRKQGRLHPRCGTSFLLLVMIITILVYACLGWNESWLLRLGTRLLMLPVIAGLSYELLRFLARHDGIIVRALRWPGLQLQRLTTREPDDTMIECAILAFQMALEEKSPEELEELKKSFYRGSAKIKLEIEDLDLKAQKLQRELDNCILGIDDTESIERKLQILSQEKDKLTQELKKLKSNNQEENCKYENTASA